jgi:hypothetical protein
VYDTFQSISSTRVPCRVDPHARCHRVALQEVHPVEGLVRQNSRTNDIFSLAFVEW